MAAARPTPNPCPMLLPAPELHRVRPRLRTKPRLDLFAGCLDMAIAGLSLWLLGVMALVLLLSSRAGG